MSQDDLPEGEEAEQFRQVVDYTKSVEVKYQREFILSLEGELDGWMAMTHDPYHHIARESEDSYRVEFELGAQEMTWMFDTFEEAFEMFKTHSPYE